MFRRGVANRILTLTAFSGTAAVEHQVFWNALESTLHHSLCLL